MNWFKTLSPDAAGGLGLLAATVAALLVVNLGGAEWYAHLMHLMLPVNLGALELDKTFHEWVNDGLMTLFFVLIGIEINRELRYGELRDRKAALVPLVAALGGVVFPVLTYLAFTEGRTDLHPGATIPMATDTAFALALLAALRNHVPPSLRAFLLALAVIDDLIAIAVIALFYTAGVVWMNVFLAAAQATMLMVKNTLGLRKLWVYLLVGIIMWICVLESGVHATVAGVLMGALLPLKARKEEKVSPADRVEHALAPWVRWVVLPLFAFSNVGVDLSQLNMADILSPLVVAIAIGLLIGKQIGIFGAVYMLEKFKLATRPRGATWKQVYGTACLCGIGFTMSLFIGALAFPDPHMQDQVRLGVLFGSLLSTILAVAVLTKVK